MVVSYTEDFAVTWQNPADAGVSWTMDQMHFPRPVPALSREILRMALEDIFGARVAFINGYIFMLNYAPPPPTEEVMRVGAAKIWQEDFIHRVRAAAEKARGGNYDAMSAPQLAGALPGLMREIVDAFNYTMIVVYGFMGPTMGLMDFVEAEVGSEGAQLLAEMLQGFENETASAGADLSALARTAAAFPEISQALHDGRYADVRGLEGGVEFGVQLDRFLETYGWRAESWSLAHVPTWAEQPEIPLMLISRYLGDPVRSPDVAINRAIEQRHAAERDLRSRLSGDKLAQFEAMLSAAQSHVAVSEGRALWQLILVGSVRVPTLALGRKLVAAGALEDPNDAFFFSFEELQAIAANPAPSTRAVAAERKALLARQEQLKPPPFVGPPPSMDDMPPEMKAVFTRFLGFGVVPSPERNVIKGNPASKGVHRGRARIIRELREADRLQPGEVLVCNMTAPPWTPLFAIAGAVVADTGGILSHSAICAREYAIPCVVGTMFGTQAIPDGAMVTVDGAAGTVTVEG